MKILYLCNYNPWDKISEQKMPSHHLFGIHQLIKNMNIHLMELEEF